MESNLRFNNTFDPRLLERPGSIDEFSYASQLKSIGSCPCKPLTKSAVVFVFLFGAAIQPVESTNIVFSNISQQTLASVGCVDAGQGDEDDLHGYWQEQLKSLALLPENWDEEGAKRISTTAIQNAQKILNSSQARLEMVEDVYGNQNGFVTLEWANNNGEYIGVQIGRRQMSYYVTRKSGSLYYNNRPINDEELSKLFYNLNSL